MRRWLRWTPAAAAVVFVAVMAIMLIGSWRQRASLVADIERLTRATERNDTSRALLTDLDAVPAPVARYLRWALPEGARIGEVRLRQAGTLRAGVESQSWMPFEADHTIVPPATGFVWSARVRIAPLLHVRVRDSLIDGRGSGRVSVMSAVTVTSAAGTPEMNSGSLHRYLAEAPWYPTALYASPNLRWTAIDASTALATLTDRGTEVSLEFRFANSGEVTSIYTPTRWGKFGDEYRQVPWEGHFRRYQQRDGVYVPTEADVGWYVDGQWGVVWRGTITSFTVFRSPNVSR